MAAGRGQTLWLSMLVEAMERFSAPEWRNAPCDAMELAGLRAHLARPAAPRSHLLRSTHVIHASTIALSGSTPKALGCLLP